MDGSVRQETKCPLSSREEGLASIMILGFILGIFGVDMTMPASDYDFLKMPKTFRSSDIHDSGTVFMSLLAGSLFGVFKGVALVVFAATAGASSCFFLFKLIGLPNVFSLWPNRLSPFQAQVAKRRERLLNYMLFLRVTPTLPNTFINFAAPIVNVPYHIFFLATAIGLIPAAYVTVRVLSNAFSTVHFISESYGRDKLGT